MASTLAQHWTSFGLMPRVCWILRWPATWSGWVRSQYLKVTIPEDESRWKHDRVDWMCRAAPAFRTWAHKNPERYACISPISPLFVVISALFSQKHERLNQCWSIVFDAGPTITNHWFSPISAPLYSYLVSASACQHSSEQSVLTGLQAALHRPTHQSSNSLCLTILHFTFNSSPRIWKGVSATLWSGRCICHFTKWQIHPLISKVTNYVCRGVSRGGGIKHPILSSVSIFHLHLRPTNAFRRVQIWGTTGHGLLVAWLSWHVTADRLIRLRYIALSTTYPANTSVAGIRLGTYYYYSIKGGGGARICNAQSIFFTFYL